MVGQGAFKKGQVAIEYLMTYGWALFVLVITIGLLAYYVQNVNQSYKEQCLFPPQVICNHFQIVDGPNEDSLFLNFTNNMGVDIRLMSINFTDPYHPINIKLGGALVRDGDYFNYSVSVPTLYVKAGMRYAKDVVITYKVCPDAGACSNEAYSITGHVMAKVMSAS